MNRFIFQNFVCIFCIHVFLFMFYQFTLKLVSSARSLYWYLNFSNKENSTPIFKLYDFPASFQTIYMQSRNLTPDFFRCFFVNLIIINWGVITWNPLMRHLYKLIWKSLMNKLINYTRCRFVFGRCIWIAFHIIVSLVLQPLFKKKKKKETVEKFFLFCFLFCFCFLYKDTLLRARLSFSHHMICI